MPTHAPVTPRTPLSPTPTRRWWEYARETHLRCPCGHRIPQRAHVTEAGFIRCEAMDSRSQQRCGKWVFLFAIRGGRLVVAEVGLDDIPAMRDLTTPAAMIEYLGIWGGS